MKRYGNLWPRIIDFANLVLAAQKAPRCPPPHVGGYSGVVPPHSKRSRCFERFTPEDRKLFLGKP